MLELAAVEAVVARDRVPLARDPDEGKETLRGAKRLVKEAARAVAVRVAVLAAGVASPMARDRVPLARDSDEGKETLRRAKRLVKEAARVVAVRVAVLAAGVARPTMQPDGSSTRW